MQHNDTFQDRTVPRNITIKVKIILIVLIKIAMRVQELLLRNKLYDQTANQLDTQYISILQYPVLAELLQEVQYLWSTDIQQ